VRRLTTSAQRDSTWWVWSPTRAASRSLETAVGSLRSKIARIEPRTRAPPWEVSQPPRKDWSNSRRPSLGVESLASQCTTVHDSSPTGATSIRLPPWKASSRTGTNPAGQPGASPVPRARLARPARHDASRRRYPPPGLPHPPWQPPAISPDMMPTLLVPRSVQLSVNCR